MGMQTGSRGGRAPLAEINVTPLVDVMLVLLIIFMVAAPMMTAGVEVNLPRADAARMEVDEEKMVLSIDANLKVFLGENEIPMARLEETLLHNTRLQADKEIFIQADARVPYGTVVQVLAILRHAGVESLGLVTESMGASENPTATPTPTAAAVSNSAQP